MRAAPSPDRSSELLGHWFVLDDAGATHLAEKARRYRRDRESTPRHQVLDLQSTSLLWATKTSLDAVGPLASGAGDPAESLFGRSWQTVAEVPWRAPVVVPRSRAEPPAQWPRSLANDRRTRCSRVLTSV